MKRSKTHQTQQNEVAALLLRIQDYKPAKGDFSYAERGRAVAEAHQLYNEAFQLIKRFPMDPKLSEASTKAYRLLFTALDAAYPNGFRDDCRKLREGDTAGLESGIRFLEADPMFFRSGYDKIWLIQCIKPPMLKSRDILRLQNVVLSLVDRRDDRDFRAYCRLARKVDGLELREGLTWRLTSGDPDIQRRARWVLEALAQKDSMEKHA